MNAFFLESDLISPLILFIFSALYLFTLVYSDHPWKAGLSVFHSLAVLFAAVMCFLSEEIYRHISLLDRHNEPQGSPKEKLPHAEGFLCLSISSSSYTVTHHPDSDTTPAFFAYEYFLGSWFWFLGSWYCIKPVLQ
jgi:hypothetical protein